MDDKFPEPLERLIHELSRLPTIGRKSAQRLAFQLLKSPAEQPQRLADALHHLHERVHFCRQCFYITEEELCAICRNPDRDGSQICVVEEPMDVASFERTGSYRGFYHVLLGRLSPLQGVMPEDLKIGELMNRVERANGEVREVILATNPNVDGDATALYISRMLEPRGISITRLGLGLPMGSSLEYADELTLQKALETRKSV
ncbi:MAG: recombination mediator RecR [Candidatus Sumerlaeaceae bacterium]